IPTGTAADSYTVFYKVDGGANAEDVEEDAVLTTIGKASPTVTVATVQNIVCGIGEFTEPVVKGVDGNTLAGALTYDGESYADTVESLKTKTNGSTGSIGYTFTPTDTTNYNTATGTINYTIVDVVFKVGDNTATAENAVTVKANPTYGDTWAQILTLNTGLKAVLGETEVTTGFSLVIDGVSDTSVKPNAENYTYNVLFTGTICGKSYTNETVASGTVEVAQKELTVSAGTFSVSKVYDGTTAAGTGNNGVFNVDGLVGNDSVTINAGAIGAYTSADVGTSNVNVTISLTDASGNYKLGNTTVSVPAVITAKPITPTVEITGSYTYTGTEITPTITVKDGTTELKSTDYTATITNNINAGTGKVTITAKSGGNYTFSDVTTTFTIGKANAPAVADIPVSYGWATTGEKTTAVAGLPTDMGTLGTPTAEISDENGVLTAGSASYSNGKVSFKLNSNTEENVGSTATIKVTIPSQNYKDITFNVVVTITAKQDRNAPAENAFAL
ncbi:MAG: YDG domain-containing protein, partial [Oscillospiraceae bacterium]